MQNDGGFGGSVRNTVELMWDVQTFEKKISYGQKHCSTTFVYQYW